MFIDKSLNFSFVIILAFLVAGKLNKKEQKHKCYDNIIILDFHSPRIFDKNKKNKINRGELNWPKMSNNNIKRFNILFTCLWNKSVPCFLFNALIQS